MNKVDQVSRDWAEHAACKGVSPRIFYPEEDFEYYATAWMRYCGICPVRLQCLDTGIREEAFGVWGGVPDTVIDTWRDRISRGETTVELLVEASTDYLKNRNSLGMF